uniref:Uncharacterized protein n=1 Tax=Globisporangium ultimum (strain ATCC 200006 / CBS 805.95 / DAOM BR144) TaxID=431595 RepID=K3X7Y3_GLOUD
MSLLLLDVQDLFYKLIWVGPVESFGFRTTVTGLQRSSALVPLDPNFNGTGSTTEIDAHASSWPHFLSTCEALTAFDNNDGFFAIASGSNCTIGHDSARRTVDQMVLSSAVRLDSLVWTACKLLFQSQQPFICRTPIVTKFLHRYMLNQPSVDISSLATPNSTAEAELLAFLDMVSKSYPLHKMVCVEGFEWANRALGMYTATIHGCASPNLLRSEFGVSNPIFHQLHRQRVWLTADVFHWFGLRFGIRQNNRNSYSMQRDDVTGGERIRAVAHTTANFTCFGPLYSLMIVLDILLFLANLRSSWEFIERVLIPRSNELVRRHRRQHREPLKIMPRGGSRMTRNRRRFAHAALRCTLAAQPSVFRPSVKLSPWSSNCSITLIQPSWVPVEHLDEHELKSMLPSTIYRSWPVTVAVVVSQLLSWLIIMPNSVVWVWGLSTTTKIQAFLSSLRIWILLAVACNVVWDCVVVVSEELAFHIAAHTFVTPLEIFVVGSVMAAWKRLDIFLMCERKWAIENQRVNDVTAFAGGFIAHANTYQPSVEVLFSTPVEILAILYGPLFQMLGASLLTIAAYLAVKGYVLHRLRPRVSTETLLASLENPKIPDQQRQEANAMNNKMLKALTTYKRLPMEQEANCPIRAKSLVRMHLEMEHTHESQRYIRPFCYLECGVLPRETRFTTRVGFTNFLPPKYEKKARIMQTKAWKAE